MKAVVFDFDGTITVQRKGSNCWHRIWEKLDDLEYDSHIHALHKTKQIDDDTWFKLISERYRQKGLNISMIHEIAKDVLLLDGVEEAFKELNKKGIKIFILSGGVRPLIEKVLNNNDVLKYIEEIETYDFVFDKKGLLVKIKRPNLNPENKNEYIDKILKKYSLSKDELLFIGNGKNDEHAYKTGVTTLCINPYNANYEDKVIWKYVIKDCNNLKQILPYCFN